MGDMKTVLITGANGYLGRHLVKKLLQEGSKVIALVRKTSNIEMLTGLQGQLEIVSISPEGLEYIFKASEIEVVIHTAASYGRKGENIAEVVNANLYFPVQLLDLCLKFGVHYFINTDTALPKSLNVYAHSKKQFLEWLTLCSNQINVLNLQLEYFYGPQDDSSKFVTFVLNELRSGKDQIDFTAATPFRDFIYIDDVVDAYYLLLKNIGRVKGIKTIEVGSGSAVMLKDIVLDIQKVAGCSNVRLNFGALPMRENEIMYSCADISELITFGWKPQYTFQQGVLKTIETERIVYD
jgi:CDP-paratose synthetase